MRKTWKSISSTLACAVLLVAASVRAAELPAVPEKLTASQAVDAYLAVVEDARQTPIKRNYATGRIVGMGDKAVPRIMELYREGELERRGHLAEILGSMPKPGGPAVAMLLDDLKSNRLNAHPNVVRALGDMKATESVPVLVELLTGASEDLRLTVLHALGLMADERAADALFTGLESRDGSVRTVCASGVIRLLVKLKEKPADVRARNAYRRTQEKALKVMEESRLAETRRMLADGMGSAGDESAAKVLRRLLKNETGDLRAAAARSLGRLKDRDALPALADLLAGDDAALRRTAIDSIAAIGDVSSVPALIDHLGRSRVGERQIVVRVLRQLTGQSFGDNPDQWRRWWSEKGSRRVNDELTDDLEG